jgi:hypothetical protein
LPYIIRIALRPAIKHISLPSAIIATVIILGFSSFPASDEKTQELISRTHQYNLRFPQERIYLHLDRPSYWANDDIWYKAYVKDSPIDESNLYVEIINSSGSVVYKNISWIQNGLAYGDIHLGDTLSTGMYQIRAYTSWMRNFDEVWFFRKDLVIWNVFDTITQRDSYELEAKHVDLQFFPEGGTFVSGVKNRIAFKATDHHGKGIDFDGAIYDDSGNRIIEIKSDYKGIGSFVLEPQKGKKYYAEIRLGDQLVKSFSLPKAAEDGMSLAINSLDDSIIKIQITERSLDPEKNQEPGYLVIGQSGGEICYHKEVLIGEVTGNIDIEKKILPGGVIRFTLFDPNLFPLCERLVFNNQLNIVPLVVKTEKSGYLPREEVKIGLAAFLNERQPCSSNLSMSVYNISTQMKTEEYSNNILTHFLLHSELKGDIENPGFYFKDDSVATLRALDNLMLTHGYREFEWKQILEGEFPDIQFPPEPSIQLTGRVRSLTTGKPVVNGKVTMMTVQSLPGVYEEETDSLGQFRFPDLFFYDTIYVVLQAVNKRGKRNTSIEIDHRSGTSPKPNYLPYSYEYSRGELFHTLAFLGETINSPPGKKWSLSDTIPFDDVYIMARRREKDDGHFRTYLNADYVFDMGNQDDVYSNVFESIEGKFPGVIYEGSEGAFYARGWHGRHQRFCRNPAGRNV